MINEYFVQFGIITFPITVYQLWIYGVSNRHERLNPLFIGLYGGGSAILCQVMPVHIFGQPENFQCIPIIIAILYGKRKAGLLSIAILTLYQFLTLHSMALVSLAGILVYSAIPFAICKKFELYDRRKRFMMAQVVSFSTIIVELIFLAVVFLSLYGKDGIARLASYFNFLGVAIIIQIVIMFVVFFLIEKIIDDTRIRKRHDSLIRYNPIGICSFDNQNRFIAVNPAYERITGYKESELLGKSRLMLWCDHQHDLAEEVLSYISNGSVKVNFEAELRHKNGHHIPVLITAIPILEQSNLVGYFAMVTDIAETKKAEEYMRNTEKLSAIGELAAGIAHEIRNPLTSIKGFLQLLFHSYSSQSKTNYYDIMMGELSRIEGIVSEMLVLSKPHAHFFRPFSLKEKLKEVAHLLQSEANMQNVDFSIQYGENNPMILGDGNQLKQVFLNIGKNAIEALPNGGKLDISLITDGNGVNINFVDNGQGIPKEILENIGKPFFTTKEKGTGLGFLISKRIVSKHNGTIDIDSTYGKGTTVSVSLPIAELQSVQYKEGVG
jgi:PAS domain S-box-containing protein